MDPKELTTKKTYFTLQSNKLDTFSNNHKNDSTQFRHSMINFFF